MIALIIWYEIGTKMTKSVPNTLPETNSSPLKMDGWKTILSFWFPAYFQGQTCCYIVLGSRVKVPRKSQVDPHPENLVLSHQLADVSFTKSPLWSLEPWSSLEFSGRNGRKSFRNTFKKNPRSDLPSGKLT